MRKYFIKLKITLFLLLVFSISGAASVLNVAVPTDPDTFNPHKQVAAATWEIAFNVYEGLVKSKPTGELVGAIAETWEIDESQTRYTFYLRDDVYFHNGRKVTTDDVLAALNNARDPEVSQGKADHLEVVDSISSEDNKVIITLKQPHAPFIYALAEMSTVIYPKDAVSLSNQPIGTGPYKLIEWRPNRHIKLERFDDYWGNEQPYFEQVYFKIMPDDSSTILNMKAGQVDLIPRLEPSLLHQVSNDERFAVYESPMNLVQLLALNNERAPFDDIRVRQAMELAVDRDEIIFGAAWGHGDKLYTGVSTAVETFINEDLADYHQYDPEKAKELLQEAGHSDTTVILDLPAPYALHVQTGEIIADQLGRIGFDVQLQIVEWGTWLERVYSQRDYDMTIVGLTGKLDPHSLLNRYTTNSSRNFVNFESSRYDELILQGLVTTGEERRDIYEEAQYILTSEVASVFLMDPSQLVVMARDIQGWESYPIYVVDVASLYK